MTYRTQADYEAEELACSDPDCKANGCPEHPFHSGGDHTYQQHHSPEDHIGLDGEPHPEQCDCTIN